MHRVWILVLVTLLAACSSQDDSAEPDDPKGPAIADAGTPVEELSTEELEALGRDPEALRELMQDPERRAALRERMSELRQAGRGDPERQDRRQAMRERMQRHRQSAGESEGAEIRRPARRAQWWENDAIAQSVGLSDAQTTRISEAHAEMMAAARQSRQQLAQAAGDLKQAMVDSDRERIEALVDARVQALEARARAEAEWSMQLLEILSDEQMKKLAQERPELLNVLLSPAR